MTKAFVLMSSTHIPLKAFIIPDEHTVSHYTGQLYRAAENVGRYGLLVEIQECGAPQAADIIGKLEPERTHL